MIERPEFVLDEHLEYLDKLCASLRFNMYFAKSCLLQEYPDMEKEEADEIMSYWLEIFSERPSKNDY